MLMGRKLYSYTRGSIAAIEGMDQNETGIVQPEESMTSSYGP